MLKKLTFLLFVTLIQNYVKEAGCKQVGSLTPPVSYYQIKEYDMVTIETASCIKCASCAMVCPLSLFEGAKGQQPRYVLENTKHCIHCGHCFAVCPAGAITLDGISPASMPQVVKAPVDATQRTTLFRTRRSIRVFTSTLVPHDVLHEALVDASYAPTAINRQNVEWILVEGTEPIQTLLAQTVEWLKSCNVPYYAPFLADFAAGHDSILRGAKQVIFAYTPTDSAWGPQDASAALSYLELSLHTREVGTCWSGIVKKAIGSGQITSVPLPEGCTVQGGLMLGYPDISYARVPVRKAVRLRIS